MGEEDDSIHRDWVDRCECIIVSSSIVLIVIECDPCSIQPDRIRSIMYRPSTRKIVFLLTVLQTAQAMSDVADKVDDTMVDLSLAMQDIGMIGNFSNLHLDEVRIAAIYLSASVMDCLTSLVEWVTRSRTFFSSLRSL